MTPFSTLEMDLYQQLFMDYCMIGGLPEVICNYVEKKTFEGSLQLLKQINFDYEEDFRKYLSGLEQTKVLAIYRSIPAQLAKENKKFQISKVSAGAKTNQYVGAIEWLKNTGIVQTCYCLNFPELPLKGNADYSKYKVYYSDTGLLIANLDDESQEDFRVNKNLGVYRGAVVENIVAEGLVKQGEQLYYYKRQDSTLEMDFFIRSQQYLIPLEVKATSRQSKSLQH